MHTGMGDAQAARVPVAMRTLGCKVNRVESDGIAADLLGRGAVLVEEDEAAVVIVNTCTVTGEADAKARKAVRRALKAAARPIVVVTGCLAALDAAGLRSLDGRVIVEADKGRVADLVSERLSLDDSRGSVAPVGGRFRTRVSLKIEDGCDNFCSYCIVPYARGAPRAVRLDELIARAEVLVAAGAREIVLTGINIGRDADGSADLADVVARIASTGITRLRLSSIEPPDLTERLLETLAGTPALCEHLHVPLQSGSDEVLRRMDRSYTRKEFSRRISAARAAIPGLAITTDLIAGFPGETDAEHRETLAYVESAGFSKLHVFRYSARPGTPAAAMEHTAATVRTERASELREAGERLRSAYIGRRIGECAEILIEKVDRGGALGTTRDYLKVRVAVREFVEGGLVEVVLGDGTVVT